MDLIFVLRIFFVKGLSPFLLRVPTCFWCTQSQAEDQWEPTQELNSLCISRALMPFTVPSPAALFLWTLKTLQEHVNFKRIMVPQISNPPSAEFIKPMRFRAHGSGEHINMRRSVYFYKASNVHRRSAVLIQVLKILHNALAHTIVIVVPKGPTASLCEALYKYMGRHGSFSQRVY